MTTPDRNIFIRSLFICWALLPICSTALAQQYEYPGEVFAGYSYLNLKPGVELETTGLNGWTASLAGYFNEWFGVAAEFGGNYGATAAPSFVDASTVDVGQMNYLFGPNIRALRTSRYAASGRVLVGASRGNADPDTFIVDDSPVRLSIEHMKFAASIGGAFDVNITPRLAFRVQPDLFLTNFGGETQENFRISTGIVIRVGTH